MSTATPAVRQLRLGPPSAGMLLTTAEFDRARFQQGCCYELINGVVVVSPTPSRKERQPNEELGYLLRHYQLTHRQGSLLDLALHEETIEGKRVRPRRSWPSSCRRVRAIRTETPLPNERSIRGSQVSSCCWANC